jgi:hypothetical protein
MEIKLSRSFALWLVLPLLTSTLLRVVPDIQCQGPITNSKDLVSKTESGTAAREAATTRELLGIGEVTHHNLLEEVEE